MSALRESLVAAAPAIRLVPVGELAPYAKNARTHSAEQIAELAGMLERFGFVGAVVVRNGTIAKGHGTLAAVQAVYAAGRRLYPAPGAAAGAAPYPEGTVPVLDVSGWSDAAFRAYVIADNQSALRAGWDKALLAAELSDLKAAGVEIGNLGFSDEELGALFARARGLGLTDPDAAPPAPTVPRSQLGDVWILGEHRLVCGDCTDPAVVALALAGARPHLMVTDPPYGVNYDPAWRAAIGSGSAGTAKGRVLNDHRADWRDAWALFPGDVAYVWHGGLASATVAASLEAVRFGVRAQIIWVKTRAALSRGAYHWQHEPAYYATREGAEDDAWQRFDEEHLEATYAVRDAATAHWRGGRKQSTVWFIDHIKNETGHGTQKPVECMQRPITNNSSAGQAVYEPFSGSGTTIVACEISGRSCHAIELSPAYVDVAVLRWQEFTGERAVHAATGADFGDRGPA